MDIQSLTHRFIKIFGVGFILLILFSVYITVQIIGIGVKRNRAERARALEEKGTKKLLQLTQMEETSPHFIINHTLREITSLSQSELGYLAVLDNDELRIKIYLWPDRSDEDNFRDMAFTKEEVGPWAKLMLEGEPLLINRFSDDFPVPFGIWPQDNVMISRFLGVPVFDQNRITAIAGLANKQQAYDLTDIRQVQLMMEGMWKILVNIKAQQELEKSEEKYRILAENATDVIWIVQISSLKSSYVSPSVQQLLGYTPEDFLNLPMEAHITTPSMEKVYQAISENQELEISRHASGHEYEILELEMIKKDGSRIWTEVSSRVLTDNQGEPDRILGIIRDITQRKTLEKKLRKSNDALRLAQKIAKIGSWSLDPENNILEWSEEIFRIFERDPNLGAPAFDEHLQIYSYRDLDKLNAALEKAVENGTPYDIETILTLPSQKTKWVHFICDPQPNPGSDDYFISGTVQDISERKNMEGRIRQSQKMEAIGTLAGGIAHDFNNILSSIIGFTELAKLKLENPSAAKESLDHVLAGGVRARELVKQILTFSRKAEVQEKRVKMAVLLKESLKFLKASIPKNIEIQYRIFDETCEVFADPTQIHQVLLNIFTNAVHAMEESGGLLNVTLESIVLSPMDLVSREILPGRYARIIIQDTGCGIPVHLMEKIFDPFFTTKRRGKGTGLGLSIAYGIIKSLNGKISAISRPRMGTEFRILLPEQTSESESDTEEGPFPLITGGKHILIVDDEPSILDWTSQLLSSLGYQVMTASSGDKGLEKFKSQSREFDLVLTDFSMPGMTGISFSKKLRAIRPDIPILLFTGFLEEKTEEALADKTVSGIMMKPVIAGELLKTIATILEDEKQ